MFAAILLPYETSKRPMFDSIPQLVDYDNDQFGKYKDEVSYADTFEGDNENKRKKKKKAKNSDVDLNEDQIDNKRAEKTALIDDNESEMFGDY